MLSRQSGLRRTWMHNEAQHLQPVRYVLPAQPDPIPEDPRPHQHGLIGTTLGVFDRSVNGPTSASPPPSGSTVLSTAVFYARPIDSETVELVAFDFDWDFTPS